MFDLPSVMFAFIVLAILLLLAIYIKQKMPLLQRLYLPESIIAGAIALLLGNFDSALYVPDAQQSVY